MLRRPPATEPRVIRRVEDELWTVLLVDHLAGKDDFVAELETDLAPLAAKIDRPRSRSRGKIEIAGRQTRQADGRQQGAHRQIFAVGDEVSLIVAAEHLPARREGEHTISGAIDMDAVPRADRDSAGQQAVVGTEQRGGTHALEVSEVAMAVSARVLERLGHRRLG